MDFTLTEEQRALQAAARAFARGEMMTVAEATERDAAPLSRDWVKRYAEMGFLGVNVATAYGGLGLGNVDAFRVLEEFAKISSAVAFPIFESVAGPVHALAHFADDALKRQVIPAVCRGEMIVAVAMSEPDAGTALTDLRTQAEVRGDRIVINGAKRWCSGGGHSDAYLVYCRLAETPGARGIGAVYVEKDTPGLTFGEQEQLMGFRGIPDADLYFDQVTVPLDHLVVPAGGFPKLMQAFDLERCGNATMALGQASGALDEALVWVQDRQQFGKPIVEFQAVQLKLAEMAMRVEAARLLIYRAEGGLPSILDSSIAKCVATRPRAK